MRSPDTKSDEAKAIAFAERAMVAAQVQRFIQKQNKGSKAERDAISEEIRLLCVVASIREATGAGVPEDIDRRIKMMSAILSRKVASAKSEATDIGD